MFCASLHSLLHLAAANAADQLCGLQVVCFILAECVLLQEARLYCLSQARMLQPAAPGKVSQANSRCRMMLLPMWILRSTAWPASWQPLWSACSSMAPGRLGSGQPLGPSSTQPAASGEDESWHPYNSQGCSQHSVRLCEPLTGPDPSLTAKNAIREIGRLEYLS